MVSPIYEPDFDENGDVVQDQDITIETPRSLFSRLPQPFQDIFQIGVLFRKNRSLLDPNKHILHPTLGLLDLVAFGIGGTVGAGIFVVGGLVAKDTAGPAVVLSFLLAAIASFFAAFCYAEFSGRVPMTGSAYLYAYVTLGELPGWFIGWDLTLEYAISSAVIAVGWSGYVDDFFSTMGIDLPAGISRYSLSSFSLSVDPLAIFILVSCTFLILKGIQVSSKLNQIITFLNLSVLLLICSVGAFYIDTSNWSDFTPYGASGVFKGAAIVFFAFIGFDSVAVLGSEVKNPRKTLPLGIIISLTVVTILYISVTLVLTGIQKYKDIDSESPFASAFKDTGLDWVVILIHIGSVTCLTAAALCSLISQPRIYYAMATDGLLPEKFRQVSSKGIPTFSVYVTLMIAAPVTCFSLEAISQMISLGTLLAFSIVALGVLINRYETEDSNLHISRPLIYAVLCFCFSFSVTLELPLVVSALFFGLLIFVLVSIWFLPQTQIPTTFACPLLPWIPAISILLNCFVISQLDIYAWLRFFVWTILGLSIFFSYSIHHSNLSPNNNRRTSDENSENNENDSGIHERRPRRKSRRNYEMLDDDELGDIELEEIELDSGGEDEDVVEIDGR